MFTYAVRGTTDCEYSRGENIVRVKLTAGDHALRASFPAWRTWPTAGAIQPDGRRKLYVDYMDVLGAFNPSTAPPPGFKKIFVCGEPGKYTAQCARQIVENLRRVRIAGRLPRRKSTELMDLVNEVRRRDSFEEGIRVAVQAVLMSPNFLFRIERDPAFATATAGKPRRRVPRPIRISDYELASRLSYFLWSSMPDDELFQRGRRRSVCASPACSRRR